MSDGEQYEQSVFANFSLSSGPIVPEARDADAHGLPFRSSCRGGGATSSSSAT